MPSIFAFEPGLDLDAFSRLPDDLHFVTALRASDRTGLVGTRLVFCGVGTLSFEPFQVVADPAGDSDLLPKLVTKLVGLESLG